MENLPKYCEKIDAHCEINQYQSYYSGGDGREWVSVAGIDDYCLPKLHMAIHPYDKPTHPTQCWRDFCIRILNFAMAMAACDMLAAIKNGDVKEFRYICGDIAEFRIDWKIFRMELSEKRKIIPELESPLCGHKWCLDAFICGLIKFGLVEEIEKCVRNWNSALDEIIHAKRKHRRMIYPLGKTLGNK